MSKTGYDKWVDGIAEHLQKKGVGNGNAPPSVPKSVTTSSAAGASSIITFQHVLEYVRNFDPAKRRIMLAQLVNNSMIWDKTPEGGEFWRAIFKSLEGGKKL